MTDHRKITMEDTTIQAWDLDRLKPAENNHKKHTKESVAKLAKSMADIGQIQPVIVDKSSEVIAGHGRLMAAKLLGWDKIKVIQVPVSRDVAIKARIADNLMSNQSIDQDKLNADLRELLGEMKDDELDLDVGSLIIDDGLAKLTDMALDDDFGIDDKALSDDILEDSKDFTKQNEEIMEKAEQGSVPLRQVFDFSTVTPAQALIIKDFMAIVMDEREETDPAAALAGWVEDVMS